MEPLADEDVFEAVLSVDFFFVVVEAVFLVLDEDLLAAAVLPVVEDFFLLEEVLAVDFLGCDGGGGASLYC